MPEQIRNIIAAGERTERDVYFQAAASLLEDVHLVHRHGTIDDLDTSSGWRTLWDNPGSYPRILAAGPLNVVSVSNEDAMGQLGARKILAVGCDASGDPQVEVIEMNGTTIVQSTKEFFWVDFVHVIDCGTAYGGAAGEITVRQMGAVMAGDDNLVASIKPHINRSCQAVAIIPNHYSGYILDQTIACSSNRQLKFGFRVNEWPGDLEEGEGSVRQIAATQIAGSDGPWFSWSRAADRIHFPSLVEMVVLAIRNNTEVSGTFTLMAVHDRYDFSIPEEFLTNTDLLNELVRLRPGVLSGLGAFTRFNNPTE